ncbi:MAG: hypothetical protein AAF353_14730, partial [Pseudomonadota bacterium]
ALPEIENIETQYHGLSDAFVGFANGPVIDLQQREFQLSSRWRSLAKAWKWIGIILAIFLTIGAYNKAVALQALESELNEIKSMQYQLVKPYLPAKTTADDNLKKLLINRMKALQTDEGDQGFINLLSEFTQVRKTKTSIEVTRISFQGEKLRVDINDQQLKNIEAVQQELVKKGIRATLENLNIKPDLISARLVMEGGAGG